MGAERKGSRVLRWGRAKVGELFGADLRSLAVFRVVLAVLVLVDLANRATDLTAHYTDQGVLPRGVLVQEALNRWSFSLNLMNGELYFQVLVFGVGALAALALLVGYHTRLANIIVWVVLLSIQYRNPLLHTGDSLLRHLLFWGMFLPLGAYWSVDRALKTASPRFSMRFLSFATVGLFLQIAFVYWFTALQKTGAEWRVDGTAIYYALSLDEIAKPLGAYLLNFPTLLTVLTFATIGFEFVGPFLLFFPFLTGPVRTGAVLAFMGFHYSIWLTMDIGIYPWVSAFCMVCFLPAWFWDRACPALFPEKPRIVGRLQRAAQRTAARLVQAYARLPFRVGSSALRATWQPTVAGVTAHGGEDQPGSHDQRTPPADTRTTHQSEKTRLAVRAEAKAEPEMRQGAAAAAVSEPAMLRSSLATNLLALFCVLYIFLWNLTTVTSFTMPERIVPLGYILGLKQNWSMFAPGPAKNDGWYVIPGTLSGGQQIDLMAFVRGDPDPREGVSWEKPQYVPTTFKNEHWRKYLENIRQQDRADLRKYFGRYICREWNTRHAGDETLESLRVAFMKERTLPDYQRSTPQRTVLLEHSCS